MTMAELLTEIERLSQTGPVSSRGREKLQQINVLALAALKLLEETKEQS